MVKGNKTNILPYLVDMKIKHQYTLKIVSLLIIGVLLCSGNAYAQKFLYGQVLEYKTYKPLADVKVLNLNSLTRSTSDKDGKFSLSAKPGDVLTFSGPAFATDTVLITEMKNITVYMLSRELTPVEIKSTRMQLGKLTAAPAASPFGGNTVLYQTDKAGNPTGGLKIMLRHKGNKTGTRYAEDEKVQVKIDQVFSEENIKKYLPVSGQELANFIILYKPDVQTYSQIDNLTSYLNTSFKEFITIPLEQRRSKAFLELSKE